MVIFLGNHSFSTKAQKELAKSLEFASQKKDAPRVLIVSLGAPSEENVNPNGEPFQVLANHVKKMYKVDIKDNHVYWDALKREESAQRLRTAVDALSTAYYQSLVARKKKSIKQLKKTDVLSFVRKSFMAAMYCEFLRCPVEALAFYSNAFDQIKLHIHPSVDELKHVMGALTMISFKIASINVALGRIADFKSHFVQCLALFKGCVADFAPVPPAIDVWAQEWITAQNLICGDLFARTVVAEEELQACPFYYYCEAAVSLRRARSSCEKLNAPSQLAAGNYGPRITRILSTALADVEKRKVLPLSAKRFKKYIAVMLAEELCEAGDLERALELCQRISGSATSRYKKEGWWSLLGAADATAALCARKLASKNADLTLVALNHALRCLTPVARAPRTTRTKMTELVLEMRKSLSETFEWVMGENVQDSLVWIDVTLEKDNVELGAQIAGSISLTSSFPIVLQFDRLTINTSKSSVRPFLAENTFPLVLKPGVTRSVPFACRAPLNTLCTVSVVSVSLSLGCIVFLREFYAGKRPSFSSISKKPNVPSVARALSAISSTSEMCGGRKISEGQKQDIPQLSLDSQTGNVDCYSMGLAPNNLCPALETLKGGLAVRGADLGRNPLTNDGLKLFSSWLAGGAAPQLSTLSLWNCQLGPQAGAHISSILRNCAALKSLNLGMNAIGDGGVAAFARSLQIAPALEELILWRVSMTKTGFIVLADNLLPPSRVRFLDIRSNELQEGSESAISSFLSKNTCLLTVQLFDNPGLGAAALKALASSLSLCNFSLTSFGEEAENFSKPLAELAVRNQNIAQRQKDGSFVLPYKGIRALPLVLLQSSGFGKRITHLDLSHNEITALPSEICHLESVVHCILSRNSIAEIPAETSRLKSLVFLDLSHNAISHVPSELGALPKLTHLLLGNNSLQSIVPELMHGAASICQTLKELDLSYNHITHLPGTISNLRSLIKLNLNNNKLAEVFNGIAKLCEAGTLQSCNLSHNELETLPPALSEFSDRINIVGNPFVQFPPEIVARGTNSVWNYLADLLSGHQICNRIKLMFVGQGNVGKTTLLKTLLRGGKVDTKNKVMGFVTGKGVRKQTDGVEVEDWAPEEDLTFSTWDFAGQEVYYNTHQFFLSQRSLYLVVFSMASPLQETNVLTWLNSLQVRAPGVSVLLIGTHADKKLSSVGETSDKIQVAINKWNKLYRKDMRIQIVKPEKSVGSIFFPVSSITKHNNGLSELRDALIKAARAQPCMKEHVPKLYLSLLDMIKRKRAELGQQQPFVDWNTLRSWGVIPDDKTLRRACRLLHDWGDIVSFQDEKALSDLVILDPNWLTQFMTTIVNATSSESNALISPQSLPQLWKTYPSSLFPALSKMLEKFEVWVKLSSGEYLVPCLLQGQPVRNSFDANGPQGRPDSHTTGRVYLIPFCPHGFFSHLLIRIWSFCKVDEYWSTGAVVSATSANDTSNAIIEVKHFPTEHNPFQAMIEIYSRGKVSYGSLMTKLVFTLHSYIRDWYGGLSDHITVLLPCVSCLRLGVSCHLFPANSFIRDYVGNEGKMETVSCPECKQEVCVEDIVPEIVGLAEGEQYAKDVVEEKPLGLGGFAEVVLGKWKGRDVAVKKLFLNSASMGAEGFTLETFEDFAMEVDIMRRLDHANVVKLYAAYSRPPAIVLEFVPLGSLDEVLKGMVGTEVDWKLCFRMATDIAQGMEYLHANNILHRDLKSPNILVHSLDLTSPVLLKVADLGLSCFYVGNKTSGKMIENPRWLAPETLLQDGQYNDKSDVYSFGIICNELCTRKIPFDEIAFNCEVENAIKGGKRPQMMEECPEKFAKIITDCWTQDQLSRPTFKTIVMRLQLLQEASEMNL